MKLLIVDDETEIREGLKNTIDWSQIGITEVITAKNGIEAIKVFEKSLPNIVLTDIRMPGMDGLELSDYILNMYPKTKIILLSGYADFSFAKQAISLGVEEYFIKPVNIDELLQKVENIVNNIKTENALNDDYIRKKAEIDTFFNNILDNTNPSPIDYTIALSHLGYSWNKPHMFAIVFEISTAKILDAIQFANLGNLNVLFENKLSAINNVTSIPFFGHSAKHICFFINIESYREYKELIKNLPNMIHDLDSVINKYDIILTTSVSKLYLKNDIKKAYNNAISTLKNKFFIGNGVILLSSQFENKKYEEPIDPDSIKEELLQAIRLADIDKCLAILQPLFRSYRFSSTDKIETIKEYFLKIVTLLSSEIYRFSKSDSEKNILQLGYTQYVERFETIDEFIKQVEIFYYDIIDILKLTQASKSNWIIEKAKEYMKKNYFEDLTVEDVANHVERNSNYLCNLFSRIEGMTITEYLNRIRIEKAKELLKTTSLMTYEIAEKVGFRNYRYFTQVFKKFVEKTPTAYRNDFYNTIK